MRDDKLKSQLYERRSVVLGGLKLLAVATLSGRLYQLQILQSDEYKVMSEENRIKLIPVLPARGKILDRFGQVLAENRNYYRIMLDDGIVKKPEDTVREIGKMLSFSEDRINLLLKKLEDDHLRGATIVDHFLQWNDVAVIEEQQPEMPGVSIDTIKLRHYPYASSTSHILGYIGPLSKKDQTRNPLLAHPDYREGKNGIELTENARLQGKGGAKRMEVNAHGLGVRELAIDKAIPGEDLHLTIDVQLQDAIAKKLAGIGGVAREGNSTVVIDILNGDILAMVSSPGYDPNKFLLGISRDDWKILSTDPDVPLINKAITNQYPAGSTFKPVTAMAGLKAGVINEHTSIYCPGYMQFGSKTFRCWKETGHGAMDIKSAMAQSCNVFFYTISQRIGIQGIADMARDFGLGHKHGLELPHEKAGLIPDPEWKRRVLGQEWYAGETINTSIGQGYVLVTPLQLALQSARSASGRKVVPRLLKSKNEPDPQRYKTDLVQSSSFEDLGLNAHHMEIVREGMRNVVNSPMGTAFHSRITEPGWEMAGKTGTAQVRGLREEDKHREIERRFRTHALFTGYAPINNPRYAVGVVVEHGGHGASAAAPVAQVAMREVQRLRTERMS
jgi:penicillin-binding protein 2